MTLFERLIVVRPGTKSDEAMKILLTSGKEKLPIVDEEGNLYGVITRFNIKHMKNYPNATRDEHGRLRVGAALGVKEENPLERAQALIAAGVDLLVIDVLHGDSPQVKRLIKAVKDLSPSVPVIGGNVATAESTRHLVDAGADGVKVGYGDGSVCTTQIVTGTGRSQFTAVVESAAEVYNDGIPIIADGGIRNSGHMVRALAAGASTVMLGSMLAGMKETPGTIKKKGEMRYKEYIGMASEDNQKRLAEARGTVAKKHAPQGIKTEVPYKGEASSYIDEWADGMQFGIANAGGDDIPTLQQNAEFEIQTVAGQIEGHPHIIYNRNGW